MIGFTIEKDYFGLIRGQEKEWILLKEHWGIHGTPRQAEELASRRLWRMTPRIVLRTGSIGDGRLKCRLWTPQWLCFQNQTSCHNCPQNGMYVEPPSFIYTLGNPSVAWMSLSNGAQSPCLCPCYQEARERRFLGFLREGRLQNVGHSPSTASLAPRCWILMADGHPTWSSS